MSFLLYLLRWQLSTPILYLITRRVKGWRGVVLANLMGGVIFFFVDRWIFGR